MVNKIIEEARSFVEEVASSQKKFFGKSMEINSKGNLVINGVEYFSDPQYGAVKKGEKPFQASTGAQYSPSTFKNQLQGKGYTNVYHLLKEGVKNNLSDSDILDSMKHVNKRWGGLNDYVKEFFEYIGSKVNVKKSDESESTVESYTDEQMTKKLETFKKITEYLSEAESKGSIDVDINNKDKNSLSGKINIDSGKAVLNFKVNIPSLKIDHKNNLNWPTYQYSYVVKGTDGKKDKKYNSADKKSSAPAAMLLMKLKDFIKSFNIETPKKD